MTLETRQSYRKNGRCSSSSREVAAANKVHANLVVPKFCTEKFTKFSSCWLRRWFGRSSWSSSLVGSLCSFVQLNHFLFHSDDEGFGKGSSRPPLPLPKSLMLDLIPSWPSNHFEIGTYQAVHCTALIPWFLLNGFGHAFRPCSSHIRGNSTDIISKQTVYKCNEIKLLCWMALIVPENAHLQLEIVSLTTLL